MKKSEFKKAINFFEASLQKTGDQPETYSNLGATYVYLGNPGTGISYLKKAINLWPNHPRFHANLGQAYMDSKQFDLAVKEYQLAIDLDPSLEPVVRDNLEKLDKLVKS